MSDICLPTSAAVPQLPAYYFKNDDVEFNMVDGGAAADLQPANSYLRIQEYDLDPSVDDPTDASKENMDNLEEAGKKMLQENVKRINVDTFDLEETNDGTYAEALDRLANILYEEKELRLKRKSMEKRGRPFIETI
ncbi:patatin-like protein 1 [Glycine soja]|uniref:patatin-like protein 1 n=1 Tax=Glycine soja TaxID=3848 RepID=UPI00103D34E8|nr:patatin-like protein 1 [Glycine soja]